MSVIIIDYGMSNLGSIRRAAEECGPSVCVSENPLSLAEATHIILPGVGSFAEAVINLEKMNWRPAIEQAVLKDKIPILGICLGMQLLASLGYENGESAGLGLIPGEVQKLVPSVKDERIPHMGWNEVYQKDKNLLFNNIPDGADFYFVHSYHFIPQRAEHIASTTPYCTEFVSAIARENIFGVQFHPEKSGYPGIQLLKNFLSY